VPDNVSGDLSVKLKSNCPAFEIKTPETKFFLPSKEAP
jgi:hypothetical protein